MLTYLTVRRQLDDRGRRQTSRSLTAMLTNSLRKSWCDHSMHAQRIESMIGKTQSRLPIKYEKDKFDELFQETGIAVLQFARGDELKMLQEEAVDRATQLPKITIHNETEVIESVPTANEMGGVTHPWTTSRSTARGCNLILRFSYASMLLRQRSNCTGISSQEARVT